MVVGQGEPNLYVCIGIQVGPVGQMQMTHNEFTRIDDVRVWLDLQSNAPTIVIPFVGRLPTELECQSLMNMYRQLPPERHKLHNAVEWATAETAKTQAKATPEGN